MNKEQAEQVIDQLGKSERVDWLNFLSYIPDNYEVELRSDIHDQCFTCFGGNIIFITDKRNPNSGYCMNCHQAVEIDSSKYNNNDAIECPACHCGGILYHQWRKRKNIERKGFLLYFQQAERDSSLLVHKGIYWIIKIDIKTLREHYNYETHSMAVYYRNKVDHRSIFYSYFSNKIYRKHKTVFDRFAAYSGHSTSYWNKKNGKVTGFSIRSLAHAIPETFLKHSQWEDMVGLGGKIVKYFEYYIKHPAAEYIVKNGLGNLLAEKLSSEITPPVDWKAKNMADFLKLPSLGRKQKQYIKSIRKYINSEWVKLMQAYVGQNPMHSITELTSNIELVKAFCKSYIDCDDIMRINGFGIAIPRILRQLDVYAKQLSENNMYNLNRAAYLWLDSLRIARDLELNLSDTAILYPKELERHHNNLVIQVQLQRDIVLDKKIAKAKELRCLLCYEGEKYLARPAADTEELIREGQALDHCVGTYCKRYANYETHIVFIRAKDNPDIPFVTMEISIYNKVVQVRAQRNHAPSQEVLDFVEEYKAKVLKNLDKRRNAA